VTTHHIHKMRGFVDEDLATPVKPRAAAGQCVGGRGAFTWAAAMKPSLGSAPGARWRRPPDTLTMLHAAALPEGRSLPLVQGHIAIALWSGPLGRAMVTTQRMTAIAGRPGIAPQALARRRTPPRRAARTPAGIAKTCCLAPAGVSGRGLAVAGHAEADGDMGGAGLSAWCVVGPSGVRLHCVTCGNKLRGNGHFSVLWLLDAHRLPILAAGDDGGRHPITV